MNTKIKKLTSMIMLCISVFCCAVGFSLLSSTMSIIVAILSLLPVIAIIFNYIFLFSTQDIWKIGENVAYVGDGKLYIYKDIAAICIYLLLIAIYFILLVTGNYLLCGICIFIICMLSWNAFKDYDTVQAFVVVAVVFWLFQIIGAANLRSYEHRYQEIKTRYEKWDRTIHSAKWLSEKEKADLKNFYFDDVMHTRDSIYSETTEKIQSIKNAIETIYNNIEIPQPQELYVKRCWFNSDETPSSYTACGEFETSLTVKAGLFTSKAQQKNDVDYSSEFVGKNVTKYVNIVLSDDSYYRFNLKKDEKWLLVREGDKVIKTYYKNKFDINNLNQNAVYSKVQLIF